MSTQCIQCKLSIDVWQCKLSIYQMAGGEMGGDESARKWGELGGQKWGGRKYGSKV